MLDILHVLQEVAAWQESRAGEETAPPEAVARLATEILVEAERGSELLTAALSVAFQEAARSLDRVSLAVTGLSWVGAGVPSVEQQISRLIRLARREITLCTYSITSAALPLVSSLKALAGEGVQVTLVVNDFSGQPTDVQAQLTDATRLLGERWRVLSFEPRTTRTELHAKILVVDRDSALVGSANLTFHGMVSNHEMALVVRGPLVARVAERVDALLKETRPVVPA